MTSVEYSMEELNEIAKSAAETKGREWHAAADRLLLKRGDMADFGNYEVYPIVQGSVWLGWQKRENGWAFAYPHTAAIYFEFGTDPHKIEPKDPEGWLAFEWPEMENEEFGNTGKTFKEVFEDSWPTVFFKEVMHPGTKPLRFLRDSAKQLDIDVA